MSYVNRRGRGRGNSGSGSGGGGNQSYNSNRRTETNRNPRAPIILAKPQYDHRGSGGRDSNDVDGYEQRPPRHGLVKCSINRPAREFCFDFLLFSV